MTQLNANLKCILNPVSRNCKSPKRLNLYSDFTSDLNLLEPDGYECTIKDNTVMIFSKERSFQSRK